MECSICYECINTPDKLTISCGHVFHSACMKKWKEQNESCPMCRKDLDVGEDMFDMQYMPDAEYEKLAKFFGL